MSNSKASSSNDKGTTAVDIYLDVYHLIKAKAYARGIDAKHFINSTLKECIIEKDAMMEKLFPQMGVEEIDKEKATALIIDRKEMRLARVAFRDNVLHCEQDHKSDCKHTRFMWAHHDIIKLLGFSMSPSAAPPSIPKRKLKAVLVAAQLVIGATAASMPLINSFIPHSVVMASVHLWHHLI